MNYEDIVFKFLSENQNDDYIGAISYGSYVKNQADTLSDIDLMIFTKNDNASYFGSHIEEGIRNDNSFNRDGVMQKSYIIDSEKLVEFINENT